MKEIQSDTRMVFLKLTEHKDFKEHKQKNKYVSFFFFVYFSRLAAAVGSRSLCPLKSFTYLATHSQPPMLIIFLHIILILLHLLHIKSPSSVLTRVQLSFFQK